MRFCVYNDQLLCGDDLTTCIRNAEKTGNRFGVFGFCEVQNSRNDLKVMYIERQIRDVIRAKK